MLLVGIDGQSLMEGGKTGLGRYTQSLIDAFKEWEGEVRTKIYMPRKDQFRSSRERLIWEQIQLPQIAMRDDLDVFHTPCFSLPVLLKFPRIITIHDIIITKRPRLMSGFSRYYFGKIIPWSSKYAQHIITNSEATKRDLVKYLQTPSEKISALLLAPTLSRDEIIPSDIANRFHLKFKVHTGYVLYVGSFEPRKNVDVLVNQYKRVQERYPEIKLILVGGKNTFQEKMEERIKKLGLGDKILFTGYLDRKELAVAYRDATIVAMPSIDEGFGLPIVEGMEMGVPVVASKIPAHVESAGGAGALFDIHAEMQLGDAMLKILSDENYRNDLIKKGYDRVKQLSWSIHARKTIEIYYRVIKQAREVKGTVKKRKGFG